MIKFTLDIKKKANTPPEELAKEEALASIPEPVALDLEQPEMIDQIQSIRKKLGR
jgi:hypothetical protein